MKIQKLLFSFLAACFIVAGCQEEEPMPTIPSLSVGQSEISFDKGGGTTTLTVTSNRPWSISTDADWLAFNPSEGTASDAPVNVTVTALGNAGSDRVSSFKVKTDFDYKTVVVTQPGEKGLDPDANPIGTGTKDDPYNVIAAIKAVENLTWVSNEDYQMTDYVYVKGKISRIADKGTYTEGGTYGNATFYISTNGATTNEFEVYRVLYLGNQRYKSGQTDIKVGDEVVIYGKLMNYRGNTPETVSGTAYLYSLNGETSGGGGGGDAGDPKGTGTAADPYNPAAAIAAVANLTWTSNDNYQSTDLVYVKGKISRIADNGTYTEGGTYGNATFYISEDGGTSGEFYVFRALYLGNKKFASGQTDIKVGDEVIVCGKLMNYRNNTPETVSGTAYLYSLNGETGGGGGSQAEPKGTGTLSDPYNPAGAADAVKGLTWTSNEDYQTTDVVYVKGKISRIADKGTFTEGGSFGNATFYIVEDGTDFEFYVYRALYLGNKKYESGQTDIKVGDEVVICGKLMNYRGNTPETVAGGSFVYSLNGKSEGGEGGGEQGGDSTPKGTGTLADPYNPAAAAAAVKDLTWTSNQDYQTTDVVYVKGKIASIANNGTFTGGGTYGNASFYISEDGSSESTFYVFRTLYLGNKKYESGQTDIKVGDEVVICGKLMNYHGNTPETEVGSSYLYSLNGKTDGGEGGGDGQSAGGGSVVTGNVETITFANCGLENSVQYPTIKGKNVTITFGGNDGKIGNNGKYYNTGSGVRIYGDGFVQVASEKTISKIVYTFAGKDYKPTANDVSDPEGYSVDSDTWTGSAKTVKLSRPTGTGNWRLQKVEVTLAE